MKTYFVEVQAGQSFIVEVDDENAVEVISGSWDNRSGIGFQVTDTEGNPVELPKETDDAIWAALPGKGEIAL